MPQMIATNSKNDIFLDQNGNISVIFGIEAVLQACEHAAKTQFGEMIFLDNEGVPNFQTIWRGGEPNISQFDSALRSAILAVEGVVGIESLDIKDDKNQLTYSITINTIYGQVISNGV
jgi:hypothetical protein